MKRYCGLVINNSEYNSQLRHIAIQPRMDDCYYFLYTVCRFGDTCARRHCEECKGSLVVCPRWKQRKECTKDCPLRHSEYHVERNRKEEMCYWETKPGGCRRTTCEYKHLDPQKDLWREERTVVVRERDGKNSDEDTVSMESAEEGIGDGGRMESGMDELEDIDALDREIFELDDIIAGFCRNKRL